MACTSPPIYPDWIKDLRYTEPEPKHIILLRARIEQEIKSLLNSAEEYAQEFDNPEGADREFAKIAALSQVLEWMQEIRINQTTK